MTTQFTISDKEVRVTEANAITAGYGHKAIIVNLMHNDQAKIFKTTTDNMPGYDAAIDLEGDEKMIALYKLVENKLRDSIAEWVESI